MCGSATSASERRAVAPQSEPLTLKALIRFNTDVLDPAVSMTLLNEHRQPVVVATTTEDHEQTGSYKEGEWAVFAFSFHNMLAPGRYHPILTITHRGEGLDVIDRLCRRPVVCRLGHDRQRRDGGDTGGDGRRPPGCRRPASPDPAGRKSAVSTSAVQTRLGSETGSAGAARQPIRGPRALDDSWSRFWHLSYNIARSEFKLKFFGSALGYLWQVMRPLLLFGVLYVFFVKIFHVDRAKGAASHFYGAQLLGSIVLFTCFGEATSSAVRSVVNRENLVRKIQFPRLAIPISVVLLALFNLGLNLIVVMIFAVVAGVQPMLSWLELPADRG